MKRSGPTIRRWLPRAALLAVMLGVGPSLPAEAADPFLRRTPTVRAVEKVGPSVVAITTEQVRTVQNPFGSFSRGDPFFDRFFQDFFEPRARATTHSLGSGVIFDDRGHVLTNEHVIARASRIMVSLADGREFGASLVGADPNNDLAVLQVETEEELPWTPPGRSDDLMVGEPVIAIGNPFGLSNTVSTGVISARDRSIRSENHVFHGFLQIDAPINPGNSGGPLLNAEGTLIGINTTIQGGGAQGIGFAIPIEVARRVVRELIEHGEVAPVWLGLHLQDLNPGLIEAMELPKTTSGVLVSAVRENGPAMRAGLRRGDVVTAMDRHALSSARDFYEVLARATNQQSMELSYSRGDRSDVVEVTTEPIPEPFVEELTQQMIGLTLLRQDAGGYLVTEVRRGSGAAQIGIKPGDLLLGVNGRALPDADALRRSVLELRGRTTAILVVQRGRGRYHVTVPLV